MPSEVQFGKFWAGYLAISIVIGMAILFFSLSIAGLLRTLGVNNEIEKSNNTISFNDDGVSGEVVEKVYKIPPAGMLPTSMFYPLKTLRATLWQIMTTGDYSRARLQLILANKKLAEVKELLARGDEKSKQMAFGGGEEAFKAIKYADEIVSHQEKIDLKWQALHDDLFMAGKVYKSYCQNENKEDQIIKDWLSQQETEKSKMVVAN